MDDATEKGWELKQGDRLIGTLIFEGQDMFWSDCRFQPGPGWAGVRPLFDRVGDAWRNHDTDAAIAADEAICAAGLVLQPSDGSAALTDFLLRIDGDKARFRW
ncbi:hypothetical protein HH310_01795 [Actinoplanes sp. TBRC 11911]|uniref:hypothetical protein n=1 Tax=Actinoplanes sp. TBRC 11911 TaxID=2729386 RepID=UPI00145DC584|nr:hypothetical protein [Actinoplanes sp. TBRC 11911]NMO49930.1 hypothetical protein [Actinoplanes sp. TBRC 11911]